MTSNATSAVLERAKKRSSAPCVLFVRNDRCLAISWDELSERVRSLMLGLERLGLPRAARVGVFSQNRWEWILIDLALAGRGFASISIDPAWSDNMLVRVLNHARAECVFAEDQEAVARMRRLSDKLPQLRSLVVIEGAAEQDVQTLEALLDEGRSNADDSRVDELLASVDAEDLATVIFTGGSTGEPKGVLRTHGNALSRGWAWFPWMGDEARPDPHPDDVLMNPLSFCHSAGRWWYQMALVRGATLALPASSTPSLHDFELLSPTHLASVPRVVLGIQKQLHGSDPTAIRERLGGRLRCIVWGGSALAANLIEFFEGAGILMRAGYGGTEAGIVSVQSNEVRRGTVGRPIGADVRVDGGEILVRGPAVTPGYLHNAAATSLARGEDGWWRTGDAGRFDEAGHLIIAGRVRAMFNCNEGTNIDPLELEQLLESDPYIREAILLGHARPFLAALLVPDGELLEQDQVTDPSAFLMQRIERLNERLEDFEKIKRIEIVDGASTSQVREITVAQKVRIDRAAVERVFADAIRAIYG